jgi:hypothetical protein
MEVRMNSWIDAADGHARVWVGGKLLLDRGGIAW